MIVLARQYCDLNVVHINIEFHFRVPGLSKESIGQWNAYAIALHESQISHRLCDIGIAVRRYARSTEIIYCYRTEHPPGTQYFYAVVVPVNSGGSVVPLV